MKRTLRLCAKWIETHSLILLTGWLIILAILYAAMSIVRHNSFQSGGFDLGIYDQEIWQYSKFLVPYNTIKDQFILGDHLNLTTPFLAPIYWIWDDVRALLIFQVVWIMASVIAVYHLARSRKCSPTTALCLSMTYSLFYGIQYLIFSDFHAVAIGVGLIPWLLYFLETGKKKLFIATLILLVLTQENMGLALVSLGFYYVWKKQYRTKAIWFIFGGILCTLTAGFIITRFSPNGYGYAPHINRNPVITVTELFNSGEKRQVWLYSFLSFGFLPLFSPGAILAYIVDIAQYFVTGPNFIRTWSPYEHYRAILAPYLMLGTLDVLWWLKQKRINLTAVSIALLTVACITQYALHLPLNKLSKREFWQQTAWMKDNNTLIAAIPKGASIVTQQSLVAHLSHRPKIYLFFPRVRDFASKPCGGAHCWWLDFPDNPQYLLVDLHPNEWITQLLETNAHVSEAISTMKSVGVLHLIRSVGDTQLYAVSPRSIK